jgi:hypothetical protein
LERNKDKIYQNNNAIEGDLNLKIH